MSQLRLGVTAHSAKENERRLPIHPLHLSRLDDSLRSRILLERGYGERFGVSDAKLAESVGGLRTREELFADCDVILLPKPQHSDLEAMREGQTLWGWPHCVQDEVLTQLAIDRRLTLIAFEAMNHFHEDGTFALHVFHKNNELAGFSSVLHALQLVGLTGVYGRKLRAAVIGFGATARGAVTALTAHGILEVDVLTHREVAAVASPIHSARIMHFDHSSHGTDDGPDDGTDDGTDDDTEPRGSQVMTETGLRPLPGFLAEHDLIVNCVLQDPTDPMIFLGEEHLSLLAPGTLIVDVSCDLGMGFSWARPTSFADPMFVVGDNVHYYAVDHTPSYLWDSATWEISEALLPYLPVVLDGPAGWDADETVRRAIEIRDGVIANPDILSFQHRAPSYPHVSTRGARVATPAEPPQRA